ncbi:MAG: hypothetical protein HFG26_00220 [Provencibacterium sp.]|jgi:hypothetical protein|nr:hypothetical protein [Provencibacterium sp.]
MKKLLSVFLFLSLALTSACSQLDTPFPVQENWYRETALPLPEEAEDILDFGVRPDGTLQLLSASTRNTQRDSWKFWESEDGTNWNERPTPWLSAKDSSYLLIAARCFPDGGLALLSLDDYTEADGKQQRTIAYRLSLLSPEGELIQDQSFSRTGSWPVTSFRITADRDLLLREADSLIQLDAGTLEEKGHYRAGEAALRDYDCRGDTLYLTAADTVQLYRLSTGEQTGSFETRETARGFYAFGAMSSRASERLLLPAGDREALYFCDQNGIWAHADGGGLLEQILEGQGTSLSLPTRKPAALCTMPDGFCILFEEGEGYHLSRFQSTGEPRPEAGELTVYILNNFRDGRLRQAIGVYELDTGMKVDYRVGRPVDSEGRAAISSADAIRTLSTELMAGNGPDVLVLDGLPIRSLREKGVLLDLDGFAAPRLKAGEWLPGIAGRLRGENGELYGIPASFSLPALFGDPETVRGIRNLEDLTDWMERFRLEHPELRPTEDASAEYLLSFFYPLCQSAWESAENAREPLTRLLENVQRIQALQIPPIPLLNDLDIAAWHEGHIALAAGELRSVSHLAQMASLTAWSGRPAELKLLRGFEDGTYLPGNILAAAANGQREEACRFIETVLDARCQTYEYYDGMPVNRQILEQQLSQADAQHQQFGYIIEGLEDTRLSVENAWPDETFATYFWEMVSEAKSPATVASEEEEAFFEAFFPCFYDAVPVEERLNGYLERIALQAAE